MLTNCANWQNGHESVNKARGAWQWGVLATVFIATLVISGLVRAETIEPELSTSAIFHSFNLRSIRSSLGPSLKVVCGDTFAAIETQGGFGPMNVTMTDKVLTVETPDWLYAIKIVSNKSPPIIHFSDGSKNSAYRTATVYSLSFDPASGKWNAVGEKGMFGFRLVDRAEWIQSDCAKGG
ncbi:MAG: hypothetical protein OQJ98_03285 [Candidatus Pacebacteria bacterium]|nr:hypothetical protein [Candidatus Paceibacterota bacterium]